MKEFVLITGLSGAGKSQAAGILEDMGFFCVDNLPTELLDGFVELVMAAEGKYDRVALVSDIRGRRDIGALAEHIRRLRAKQPLQVLFLEASEQVIVNRYKETRHRHPLDARGSDLSGAIRREKAALVPLRELADHVVDTSGLNWSSLKLRLSAFFPSEDKNSVFLHICSFGFKNGIPAGADLVMDVRFLPNPFYVEELKNQTGLDAPVRDYVCASPAAGEFLEKMTDLLTFLLPKYKEEGKSGLLLAIGCTGGRHRSVVIAEKLTEQLRARGCPADCVHRELR
jgi:UPF0042 nucleotide-binding protein